MSCPVTQRSPKGAWRTVWEFDWWIFTSIPYGEQYKTWVKVRHPINLHKVRPARVKDVIALSQGLSFLWCFLCMQLSGQWTYPACIYTVLQGSHG